MQKSAVFHLISEHSLNIDFLYFLYELLMTLRSVDESLFKLTLQIKKTLVKILYINYKIYDVTSALWVFYSFPANSNVTSSPISTNGAQYLTALKSLDSLIQFIV